MRPGPHVTAIPPTSATRSSGPFERRLHDRHDVRDVLSRGELRNDPAIRSVHLVLRRHDAGRELAVREHGRCGVVAGGFDA